MPIFISVSVSSVRDQTNRIEDGKGEASFRNNSKLTFGIKVWVKLFSFVRSSYSRLS